MCHRVGVGFTQGRELLPFYTDLGSHQLLPHLTVTLHENGTITGFRALASAHDLRSLRPWVRLNGMRAGSIPAERFLVV